jgi:type II secretion system protein H
MLISAIGRRSNQGFTLIELLAVLTILGLTTSVVMLSIPSGRPNLVREAESAAARLALARDEAIAKAKPMTLVLTDHSYAIVQDKARKWNWAPGLKATATDLKVQFDASGMSDRDTRIRLTDNNSTASILITVDGAIHVE